MTEQEQQELMQQAEYGRKAKIAKEFFEDFLLAHRVRIITTFENEEFISDDKTRMLKAELRLLRLFDNSVERYIEEGKIAEKELSENG